MRNDASLAIAIHLDNRKTQAKLWQTFAQAVYYQKWHSSIHFQIAHKITDDE